MDGDALKRHIRGKPHKRRYRDQELIAPILFFLSLITKVPRLSAGSVYVHMSSNVGACSVPARVC